jgi:hypothetical protein
MLSPLRFRKTFVSVFILFLISFSTANASWRVTWTRTGNKIKVLRVERSAQDAPASGKLELQSIPEHRLEDGKNSASLYEEFLFAEGQLPKEAQKFLVEHPLVSIQGWWDDLFGNNPDVSWKDAEVRTLVHQGPKENRINLTILGDGYTLSEKKRFFEDAQRITDDLFKGQTFAWYLPLFNVYAVFVPSAESGLTDVEKKKTAFALYRDPKGSKRAIMPGNSSNLEKAVDLAPATDFPIVLANDEFYGGLGGRYAITTRSIRSGSIVLRHELGHNFGNVGEEYDGGQVYRGANFTSSASNVSWEKWFNGTKPGKVQATKYLNGSYVWQNLGGEAFRAEFDFPAPANEGAYSLEILLSTVGWESPTDVEVRLDGIPLELEGDYTEDRSFFKIRNLKSSLAAGKHVLEVEEKNHDGNNVLAFASVYAHESNYDYNAERVALYSTFNDSGSFVGYRPTHESCLMRNMTFKNFCSADIENMWVRFLNRVSLIDSLAVNSDKTMELQTPNIEGLQINWSVDTGNGQNKALPELKNKTSWKTQGYPTGKYTATVQFETKQVRNPTSRFKVEKTVQI